MDALTIKYRGLDSVQTTGEKAACLHDATSAFDHEDNLDGQCDKQGNTRTNRLPSMEDLLSRKNHRWTGHLTRMSPNRLPKQVLYSQLSSGKRASSSPIQGYRQEKHEDERYKDRLMDITLTAERQMESNSQVTEAVFVASRPTA